MYIGEISPKQYRGAVMALNQLLITIGKSLFASITEAKAYIEYIVLGRFLLFPTRSLITITILSFKLYRYFSVVAENASTKLFDFETIFLGPV